MNPTEAGGRAWVLRVEAGRPIPANAYRRMHWTQRRNVNELWRWAGFVAARQAKVPPLARMSVTVTGHFLRRPFPDAHNMAPCAKAAIDGLVDADVVYDDSDPYVVGVTHLPGVIDNWQGLEIRVTEVLP